MSPTICRVEAVRFLRPGSGEPRIRAMLRDHLPPLDNYLADAMSLGEADFLHRYRWPWLIVPEPSPDILSQIRRPETVVARSEEQTSELGESDPIQVGASLDALCLELRPLSVATRDVVIGRSPDCDVVLLDESVSRQHARLRFGAEGARLEDLQARNGTFIEGRRLVDGGDGPVPNGAAVRFGAVPGRFYQPEGFLDWLRVGAPRSGAAPGQWPGREG